MSDIQPIRLVIIDDHPVIRSGFRGMLAGQREFEYVGEAENGETGLEVVTKTLPHVVLLDLRLPDIDGLELIEMIHAIDNAIRILIVTSYSHVYDIKSAMQKGAMGYVLKDIPRDELYDAIRNVARGQIVLSQDNMSQLIGLSDGSRVSLSEREIQILERVANGIINKAIGKELSISEATVKTHLSNIYRKLGVIDRAAAVAIAVQRRLIDLQ